MHIISVSMEGFKCYKDRTEPGDFCPHHNVIGMLLPVMEPVGR